MGPTSCHHRDVQEQEEVQAEDFFSAMAIEAVREALAAPPAKGRPGNIRFDRQGNGERLFRRLPHSSAVRYQMGKWPMAAHLQIPASPIRWSRALGRRRIERRIE